MPIHIDPITGRPPIPAKARARLDFDPDPAAALVTIPGVSAALVSAPDRTWRSGELMPGGSDPLVAAIALRDLLVLGSSGEMKVHVGANTITVARAGGVAIAIVVETSHPSCKSMTRTIRQVFRHLTPKSA